MHAREWLSVSTALYLISQLVEDENLITGIEWRIIPVLNPDGYVYSWTKVLKITLLLHIDFTITLNNPIPFENISNC